MTDTQTRSPQSASLADVYQQHTEHLRRYVFNRCGSHELAQDIVQDVFLKVALLEREPSTITLPWLVTVARHRLIDVLRRQQTGRTKTELASAGQPRTSGCDTGRIELRQALQELRPAHRDVLVLRYMAGYPTVEVATVLGRTPKGIEALARRARIALRHALA